MGALECSGIVRDGKKIGVPETMEIITLEKCPHYGSQDPKKYIVILFLKFIVHDAQIQYASSIYATAAESVGYDTTRGSRSRDERGCKGTCKPKAKQTEPKVMDKGRIWSYRCGGHGDVKRKQN